MTRTGLLCLLTALALTLAATPALAKRGDCAAAVQEKLRELSIPPDDVTEIRYQAVRQGTRGGGGRVVGIEAWIKLASCRGNLVVQMRSSCKLRGHYGTGDC